MVNSFLKVHCEFSLTELFVHYEFQALGILTKKILETTKFIYGVVVAHGYDNWLRTGVQTLVWVNL